MKAQKYKPLIDKMLWITLIPTAAILLAVTVMACFEPASLWIMIPTDLVTLYLFVSPLFGYAELREDSLFIKFGFVMKREIPYSKIRGLTKDKKFYSESMLSLKNAFEHVNIKYNSFDVVTVSVIDNDGFIKELEKRRKITP